MRFCTLISLLLLVNSSYSQLRTLTSVNLRSRPSVIDSEIICVLKSGTLLKDAILEDGWYCIFADSIQGYVKSDFVADYYFEKPCMNELIKESYYSYILAVNSLDSSLALLVDNGWGGAIDGPALSICISNYSESSSKNKELQINKRLPSLSTSKEIQEQQQALINLAWDEMGVAIQQFLFNNNFTQKSKEDIQGIEVLSCREIGVECSYETISTDAGESIPVIHSITYQGQEVWRDESNNIEGGAKEIVSVLAIGEKTIRLLIEFAGDNHPYFETVYFER